jgi:hypothetical protein
LGVAVNRYREIGPRAAEIEAARLPLRLDIDHGDLPGVRHIGENPVARGRRLWRERQRLG